MKHLDGLSGLSAIALLGLIPAGVPAQNGLKPQVARYRELQAKVQKACFIAPAPK